VLLAASLHVVWNTLVKVADDSYLATVAIAVGGGLICAVALPFLPQMNGSAWLNVAGSVVAQSIYYPLVAAAYRAGDMSLTYPLMRGTAPLLVAVVSGPIIGEHLAQGQWAGIALICVGIWAMSASGMLRARAAEPTVARSARGIRPPRALVLALINAAVIATYTLIDGTGARVSGAPLTYTAWLFVITALPMGFVTLLRRPRELLAATTASWWLSPVGGLANVGAYGLVLWAMTKAPVATVAALRETAILFATVTAIVVLKEKVNKYRIGAAIVIAAGVMVLRLA